MLRLFSLCGLVGNFCSFSCSLSLKFCQFVLIRTVTVTNYVCPASYNITKSSWRLNVRQTCIWYNTVDSALLLCEMTCIWILLFLVSYTEHTCVVSFQRFLFSTLLLCCIVFHIGPFFNVVSPIPSWPPCVLAYNINTALISLLTLSSTVQ